MSSDQNPFTYGLSGPLNLTDAGSNMHPSSPAHSRKEAKMPETTAPDYAAWAINFSRTGDRTRHNQARGIMRVMPRAA